MKNLSEKIIQKLSNPDSFEKGGRYYKQGRVTGYSEKEKFIEATVIGTELYKVKISKDDLSAECSCPAFTGKDFCKHLVAVLLTTLSGEIIPKSKPAIKNKGSKDEIKRDQQFKSSLQNIPREILINDVAELGRTHPDIEEFFIQKYSEKTAEYYRQIEIKVRKKINSILSHIGRNDYHSKVFTASREVYSLLQNLPPSRQTTDFLLGTGYWITEKLAEIDDSNAYLQDLIWEIIENACDYLNYARADDLILFYKYTSLASEFDFNTKVIKVILDKVSNQKITEAIITKLERTIYKTDPDLGFKPEYGWEIMMKHLRERNILKYEEMIPEVIDKSFSIKLDYINYLFESGRYEEVIAKGRDNKDHPEIKSAYEKSILALNDIKQITEYYSNLLEERFDLETFKRFTEIDGIKESEDWKIIVEKILADNKHIFYHAELLLYLKRNDEFMEFIYSKGEEFYRNNSLIEKHAARFTVTDPSMAIRLYHYLIDNELERIKRSNRYFTLIEYFADLKELNDLEYIENLRDNLIRNNPTKIKLLEALNEFQIR
ncbi:MAG: SWIM zinc finger family protein [Ignavibacteriaceae bacterium]|nr:SWIM zinc finger family protein [Ignavibacteriaceae bacterium]